MKRKHYFLLIISLFACCIQVVSQDDPVLMRINDTEVLRSEFEYAYNKSLLGGESSKKKINEFTDLFIINKLKISEAKKSGLDAGGEVQLLPQQQRKSGRKEYDHLRINNVPLKQLYAPAPSKTETEHLLITQIFKYLPQNTAAIQQRQAINFMDSLYEALNRNSSLDFRKFVATYSDDKKVFWISRKQMPKEFENEIFSLPKESITRPFQSPLGIHIVKVLDKQVANPGEYSLDKNQQKQRRSRDRVIDTASLEKLKTNSGYIPRQAGIDELFRKGETDKPLFLLNGKEYTGKEFARFSGDNVSNIQKQFDRFVAKCIFDSSLKNTKIIRPDQKLREQAYSDSILLNKITEIKITRKSREKAGLVAYFSTHKKEYSWNEPKYKGIVLHCADKKTAKRAKKLVKKKPVEQWADIINKQFNTGITPTVKVEQGLFAEGDNQYVDRLVFKKGNFLPLKGYPYTSVIGKKSKKPETYEEAGKSLQSDYRNFLESLWISELRRNSKVEINEEVLKTVNNH